MHPTYLLAYFFGGMFLANAIPHFVQGISGHPFQSPFAKPPGEGLSSSTVNIIWGFANLVLAYLLLIKIGTFDLHSPIHMAAAALGAFILSVLLARHFGRFHGGNLPS